MNFEKPILHSAEARKDPQSIETRFRQTRKIKKNALLNITRNVPDKSPMVLFSIVKGGLVTKEPNTVQNGLNNVARKSGPFIIRTGPDKKEDKRRITNKSAAQNEGKGR